MAVDVASVGKIKGTAISGAGTSSSPIVWPSSLLQSDTVMFARRSMSRSGGQTISGIDQIVSSSTDFWEAQIRVKIRRDYQRLAFRALMARSNGRASHWLIPVCAESADIGAFDQGFSSGFQVIGSDRIVNATTASVLTAAAAGSRSLVIRMVSNDQFPVSGQYFSIGSRLYLIGDVSVVTAGVNYNFTITFSPGLRAAAIPQPGPSPTSLDFLNPKCRMRLAQDNMGDMSLEMLRFSDVQLGFVEIPA
jgi:hypothetical protein